MRGANAYDDASIASQQELSTTTMESSSEAGWTSFLVDRQLCSERFRDFELHPTPDLHLVVQLEGHHRLEALQNGAWRTGDYGPGSVGMAAGDETGRFRSYCTRAFEVAHAYLPHLTLLRAAETLRLAGQRTDQRALSTLLFDDPAVANVVRAMLRGARLGLPDLYAQEASCWLATHLLVTHAGVDPRHADPRGLHVSDARLGRAIALIRARFAEPLSLDELAREAAVSKFHFSRLFRDRTGRSPHAFLVEVRLDAARTLLARSDVAVAEVARRVGYGSAVQFGAAFRRAVGLTPSEFRRQHRDGGRILSR